MFRGRTALSLAAAAMAIAGWALALPGLAAAEPPPGETGAMYRPDRVVIADLTLSDEAIAQLEAEPDEYVEGGFALHLAEGPPGAPTTRLGPTLEDPVGVRLKGHEGGSFRSLDEKPGFKIKFKEFGGPKFMGLKKMTLNNMVQDPSMLHETLAYASFRALGVPAPRTGFAEVFVNGENYGTYLNLEDMDDVALERWFGEFEEPPQHLYEGEYGADVTPGGAGAFEVDEGSETDLGDLENLIEKVNESGADWSTQVAPVIDLEEMTRMWAVEKYAGHWDGYSGEAGIERPNNYYLYSSPDGVFQMLPWGTDQTWETSTDLAFDGPGGLMFNKCLADSGCEGRYREAVATVGAVLPGLELDSLAGCVTDELAPWQELESPDRREFDSAEIAQGVADTRDYLASRPDALTQWLAANPSPTEPTERGQAIPCEPLPLEVTTPEENPPEENPPSDNPTDGPSTEGHPAGGQAGGAPPAGAPAAAPPSGPGDGDKGPAAPAPRILSARVVGSAVRARVRLGAAGSVREVVRLRRRGHRVRVCQVRGTLDRAGDLTLSCRLSKSARRLLARHRLRLLVELRFDQERGRGIVRDRQVVAPRRK